MSNEFVARNGLIALDNSQITGSLVVTGSTTIIGPRVNLSVSGSSNVVTFRGSGSVATSSIFTVDGAAGRLFTVNDSLSGSLFSVNTVAGLPVMEAFSNNTVRMGQYGQQVFYISQSKVGVGKENALNATLDVSGSVVITGSLFVSSSVVITGSLLVSSSVIITGSLRVSGSITGSLFGTASFALNAGSAGFPYNGDAVITGSLILTSGSAFPGLLASESLAAGDFVNITGSLVRKASSSGILAQAQGFVTGAYASASQTLIFYSGLNTSETGLTVGARYFLSASGNASTASPSLVGQLSQEIGVAVSPTAILVNFGPAILT